MTDKKIVDSHLGLFRSLSEQELAAAEARASRRFQDAPAQAPTAPVEETASRYSVAGWKLGLIGVAAVAVAGALAIARFSRSLKRHR